MAYDAGMTVYFDDEPTDLAADNLAALLEAASDRLSGDGRMIVEVKIEDETFDLERLDEAQDVPVASREVRLTTADPSRLAVQTLYALQGAMEGLRQTQADAAEKLQEDKPSEAMASLQNALAVWMQAQQAVLDSARVSGVDLDELKVEQQPASEIINQLVGMLHELKETVEAGDTVALADSLAYEWPDMIDRWQLLVGALIDRLDPQSSE